MHINVNANAWYKYKPLYSEAWNDWSNGLNNMSHDVINNLDGHTKKKQLLSRQTTAQKQKYNRKLRKASIATDVILDWKKLERR